MIMYYNNELTITMKNKMTAKSALLAAKETLSTTTIAEYCEGEFAKFADSLFVKVKALPPQSIRYFFAKVCLYLWMDAVLTPLWLWYRLIAWRSASSVSCPPYTSQNR